MENSIFIPHRIATIVMAALLILILPGIILAQTESDEVRTEFSLKEAVDYAIKNHRLRGCSPCFGNTY